MRRQNRFLSFALLLSFVLSTYDNVVEVSQTLECVGIFLSYVITVNSCMLSLLDVPHSFDLIDSCIEQRERQRSNKNTEKQLPGEIICD